MTERGAFRVREGASIIDQLDRERGLTHVVNPRLGGALSRLQPAVGTSYPVRQNVQATIMNIFTDLLSAAAIAIIFWLSAKTYLIRLIELTALPDLTPICACPAHPSHKVSPPARPKLPHRSFG
jgi:hypothetical protein